MVGWPEGTVLGRLSGKAEGLPVGCEGAMLGCLDGACLGSLLGIAFGDPLGGFEGCCIG